MSEEQILEQVESEEVVIGSHKPEELQESSDNNSANDLEHMLPEDLAGKIIRLSPWTPFYKFDYLDKEKGQVELFTLSAFSGDVTYKVPKGLPKEAYVDLMHSLKLGVIMLTDKLEKDKEYYQRKNTYRLANDQRTIDARIFVSELSLDKFKLAVRKVMSTEFLNRCIDVELMEKNRAAFLEVLRARVKELA